MLSSNVWGIAWNIKCYLMDFNLYTLNIPTPFLHADRDLNTINEVWIHSSNVVNEIWQTYKLYHYEASKKASLYCKLAYTHHFRHTSFYGLWTFLLTYFLCTYIVLLSFLKISNVDSNILNERTFCAFYISSSCNLCYRMVFIDIFNGGNL